MRCFSACDGIMSRGRLASSIEEFKKSCELADSHLRKIYGKSPGVEVLAGFFLTTITASEIVARCELMIIELPKNEALRKTINRKD